MQNANQFTYRQNMIPPRNDNRP